MLANLDRDCPLLYRGRVDGLFVSLVIIVISRITANCLKRTYILHFPRNVGRCAKSLMCAPTGNIHFHLTTLANSTPRWPHRKQAIPATCPVQGSVLWTKTGVSIFKVIKSPELVASSVIFVGLLVPGFVSQETCVLLLLLPLLLLVLFCHDWFWDFSTNRHTDRQTDKARCRRSLYIVNGTVYLS